MGSPGIGPKGLFVVLAMALFLAFAAGPSMAAEFKVDPYLTLREEYNDNIFLTESLKEDAFITRVLPGVESTYRTERLDLRLSGWLQQWWYSRLSSLDALDQFYRGSIKYTLTPHLSVSGTAGYSKDSQPERDILITGLTATIAERQRQKYGVSGTYIINEKTLSSLSYNYYKDTYLEPRFFLNNIETNSVNLGFVRDLGTNGPGPLKGRLNFGYSHYLYTDTTVNDYRATVGLSSDLHENWNFRVDSGVRRSNTDFTIPGFGPAGLVFEDRTERSWGWVLLSALSYKAAYGTAKLSLNHELVPAGGQRGVTERTGAFLDLTYRFTYELSGTFATSYIRNKADRGEFGTLGVDTDTFYIIPGIRYAFTKDITLDATYNFLRSKDKLVNTTADRNLFLIQLRMQHSLFD